jgi:hypothetical protein
MRRQWIRFEDYPGTLEFIGREEALCDWNQDSPPKVVKLLQI